MTTAHDGTAYATLRTETERLRRAVPLWVGHALRCIRGRYHSRFGRRWRAFGMGWATLLAFLPIVGAADPAPAGVASPPEPRVLSVSSSIRLGRKVTVQMEGLRAWVDAGNSPHKLVLYLDGRPSPGDFPDSVSIARGELGYHLGITPENRDLWEDLLRHPTYLSRRIPVSVGPSLDSHFVAAQPGLDLTQLQIVPFPWGLITLAVLALTLVGLISMARTTGLLRDPGSPSTPERQKPYSLSRTQMAVWFYLIFAAYLAIWLVTGDLNTITQSLLGLMGISAGTALGGAVIDGQKREDATEQLAKLSSDPDSTAIPSATANPSLPSADLARQLRERIDPGVSQGFLRDLLSDGEGLSLHRFQIAAWTVALGVIFIADTYNTLRMPEFSATLLGLMGLSAGTYLGFKVPEK